MRNDRSAPSCANDPRIRGALLMPICTLALHQLRYYLAFGGRAPARLGHEGHAYVLAAEPVALLAVALTLGMVLGGVARASRHGGVGVPRSRLLRLWLLCAITLLSIYCAQELFEGLFAAGHPDGLAGIFGHGGWLAAPLSLLVGAALAATLKLVETIILRASRRASHGRTAACADPRTASGRDWRLDPRSGVAPSRAPPLAFSTT